jgi:hypothetical protein
VHGYRLAFINDECGGQRSSSRISTRKDRRPYPLCRLTISLIQMGANGEVQLGGVG